MQTRVYGFMGTKLGDAAVNWLPTAANTLNRAQSTDSRRQRLWWLMLTAWRLQSGFVSDGAVAGGHIHHREPFRFGRPATGTRG